MENNAPNSASPPSTFTSNPDDIIEANGHDDTESLITSASAMRRPPVLRKSDCSSDWCTTPPVYFLLFTNLVMILMVFILPVICESHKPKPGEPPQCVVDPFSMLIYTHTLYWFSHLIIDQYLKYHHRRGRLRGYLEFYIQTKNLRRTPFYIISFGNAILLVTVTAVHDICDHSSDASCEDKETKIELLRGLITLQCMGVAFMWVKYIMAVKKFKKDNRPPDLYRSEFRQQVLGIPSLGSLNTSYEQGMRTPVYPPVESRDETDLLNIQSELLVYLCPVIGQENDDRLVLPTSRGE